MARMHGQVKLSSIEELLCDRTKVISITQFFEGSEMVRWLVVQNSLHPFFAVEDSHKLIATSSKLFLFYAEGIEVIPSFR